MDDPVVDTLKIEIVGDSGGAVKSIDDVIESLDRIKSVTAGANRGLAAVQKHLEGIKNAISGLKGANLSWLKDVGNVKIPKVTAATNPETATDQAQASVASDAEAAKLNEVLQVSEGVAESLGDAALKAENFNNATQGISVEEFVNEKNEVDILGMKLDDAASKLQKLLDSGETDSGAVARLVERIQTLQDKLDNAKAKVEGLSNATQSISVDEFINGKNEVDVLSMKLGEAKAKLQELLNSGETDSGAVARLVEKIQSLEGKLEETTPKARSFRDILRSIGKGAKSVGSEIGNAATKPFEALKKKLENAGKKFGNLLTMFKKRVLYRIMNSIISGVVKAVKEGLNNVYQYSKGFGGTFSKSLDMAATSLQYFKNSIGAAAAPLLNMLVPALQFVIEKCVDFFNILNQLFARLSGASSWTHALVYPREYAEATDNATAANKRFKASILGIDELNLMQDNSSGGGGGLSNSQDYSEMFEELPLEGGSILGKFFQPFVDAWNSEGRPTFEAIKRMLDKVKGLFQSIGTSISTVFSNGTGAQTLEHILGIIQGISDLTGNLADSFREAWDENDRGKRIVQSIWGIFNSVLGTIRRIIQKTAEWAKKLDLGPLLESIASLFESLEPIIDGIGTAIEFLWDHIVLPIFSWLIEDKIPNLITGLTGINEFISGVFSDDWELAWEGVKKIFGSIFTDMYNDTIGILAQLMKDWTGVDDWFDTEVWQPIKNFFINAWDSISRKATEIWDGIKETWEVVSGWFDENVLTPLWEFFEPIFTDIGILASDCWNIIKEAWRIASTWFDENVISPIGGWFEETWNNVKTWASEAWEGIKSVFEPAINWFKDTFRKAWEKVVEVFSPLGEVFVNIKNAIASVFTTIVNGLITGINKVIAVPFKGINAMIKKLREAQILGLQPFAGLQDLNIPEIPLLQVPQAAEGGTFNSGTMFIAGEAGAEVVASMGSKTGVMNVDQMEAAVSQGVMDANLEQNAILRTGIQILEKLLQKDTVVNAVVDTGDITRGLARKNRRDGYTVVPVGV